MYLCGFLVSFLYHCVKYVIMTLLEPLFGGEASACLFTEVIWYGIWRLDIPILEVEMY